MAHLTLNLPDSLLEHAKYFGQITHRDAAAVLTDALKMMWPVWDHLENYDIFHSVAELSDAEVLELANLKMDQVQNDRLGKLPSKGKTSGLTPGEQFELLTLAYPYAPGRPASQIRRAC